MPEVTSRFTLPVATFPAGPYGRSELSGLTMSQLAELEVTPTNVHQIAYFGARVNAEAVRNAVRGVYNIEPAFLEDTRLLESYFRGWPSNQLADIIPVLEQYKVVVYDTRCWIYLPEIYFVDDCGLTVRCGPFLLRPKGIDGTPAGKVITTESNGTLFSRSPKWTQGLHPHISSAGNVCLGTESSTYYASMNAGDNLGVCMAMESILPYYNPGDPYYHMSEAMPGEVIVPPFSLENALSVNTHGEFRVKLCTEAEKTVCNLHGIILSLTAKELELINDNPTAFLSFFKSTASDYKTNNLPASYEEFMRRALPSAYTRGGRLIAAGIRVTDSFNADDEPLEAAVLTPDRRLTIDLPDRIKELAYPPEDISDPEEANDGEDSQDESQEECSDTPLAVSNPESPV